MTDIEGLCGMLARVEALAASGPDWARTYLADLLDEFRPRFSTAALRADAPAFAAALSGLALMVKRCLLTMAL